MPIIWVFVWCQCFSDLMTQARNHTCAPLITTQSPHHSHHTSWFLIPTKYHTWQFFPQLLHQQYCAIQEGHQQNNANKEGTKKGNRTPPKEVLCGNFGSCIKEESCHHCTIPPTKERAKQQDCSLSSLRNQRYASHTQTVSSNPTSESTEAIGVGTSSPLPSEQVVTRLWSKGAVVKEIYSVQDESTQKKPSPAHHGVKSLQLSTWIECSTCYNQITHQFCCSCCIYIYLPEELCWQQFRHFRWEWGEESTLWQCVGS